MIDATGKRQSNTHLGWIRHDCQENNKLIVQKNNNNLDNLKTTVPEKWYKLRQKKCTVHDLQQNHRDIYPPVPTTKPKADINCHNSYTTYLISTN